METVTAIAVSHPDTVGTPSPTFHPVVGVAVAVFRLTSVGRNGTSHDWYIAPKQYATTGVVRPTYGHADGHTTEVVGWGAGMVVDHLHWVKDVCEYGVKVDDDEGLLDCGCPAGVVRDEGHQEGCSERV